MITDTTKTEQLIRRDIQVMRNDYDALIQEEQALMKRLGEVNAAKSQMMNSIREWSVLVSDAAPDEKKE